MKKLFKEFETADKQSWLSKIEADAKGKSITEFDWEINQKLVQSPFTHPSESISKNSLSYRGQKSNRWNIGELIVVKDLEESNRQIITALENGANSIHIAFGGALSRSDFDLLFSNVNFTYIKTYFRVEDEIRGKAIVENLIRFCKQNNLELSLVEGGIYQTAQCSFESQKLFKDYHDTLPKFSFASASMDQLFGYKETVVHEVVSLALGLIRILESKVTHDRISLNINIGKSYLLNIAKVRAVHILVNNLLTAYQSESSLILNAQLSHQSISKEENVNLIQFTSQAMSAAIGGINGIVLPASDKLSENGESDFRKRLSRNVQSIMQMESFMDKVVDPAAGSYYIEKMTSLIAEQSWSDIQNNS